MRALSICFSIVFLFASSAVAGEPVAKINEIKGSATIIHSGESAPHAVNVNDVVFPADVLETAADGRVVVRFADGTELVVSGKGRLAVDDYVFDPQKPAEGRAKFSILGAAFSYVSGLLDKRDHPDVTLQLEHGSIGIRGTKILGAVANGRDIVFLESGKITFTNEAGEAILNPGEGTSAANKNEVPARPYMFTPEEVAWLRSAVDNPLALGGAAMASNVAAAPAARAEGQMAAAEPVAPPGGGGAARDEAAADLKDIGSTQAPAAPAAAQTQVPAVAGAPAATSASAPVKSGAKAEAELAGKSPPEDLFAWQGMKGMGTKVSAEEEGVVRVDTKFRTIINLGVADVSAAHLDDATLLYTAQLKAKDLTGYAYLEMWVHFPGGKKGGDSFYSRGVDNLLTGGSDWKTFRTPFLVKKGKTPDKVTLNLVIVGAGTVWVKDVRLQH